MSEPTFSTSFTEYLKKYTLSKDQTDELELRFGTNRSNKITRTHFDNVIKKLKLNNYACQFPNGQYHLNIQNEFLDEQTGLLRTSNIRTEIKGLMNIKKYCLKNVFNLEIPEPYITFIQKKAKQTTGGERVTPLDSMDFEFRVNYKTETKMTYSHPLVRRMLDTWNSTKKTYRLIKRLTFEKQGIGNPLKFDLSIVKTSKWDYRNRKYIPESTIQKSNVFKNEEQYEIEIELVNPYAKSMTHLDLKKKLNNVIKLVLSGLQQTNFPISYTEQKAVL